MINAQQLAEELLFEEVSVIREKLNSLKQTGQVRSFQILTESRVASVKVTLADGREITIGQV
jgi:hypothetical protein